MGNRDVETARAYHAATKHTYMSVRTGDHHLDWETKPTLYKVYPNLPAISLPREILPILTEALAALASEPDQALKPSGIDLPCLVQLLFYTGGITRTIRGQHFRAAASAGALYPVEVYAATAGLEGLEAGIYHFCPGDFSLRKLRPGDWRPALAEATGGDERVMRAPLTLVFSGIFWRSAWKYRARSYRYLYWDGGTMAANLTAVAAALGHPAPLLAGFVDEQVCRLLGLDGRSEAALCLFPVIGTGPPAAEAPVRPPPPLRAETIPLSSSEVEYPEMQTIHAASCLVSRDEVAAWREAPPMPGRQGAPGSSFRLGLPQSEAAPRMSLGETILRRGSSRQFRREAIRLTHLSTLLEGAMRPLSADFLGDLTKSLLHTYLIANAVEGLPPGAYFVDPIGSQLVPLKEGDFRNAAGYLCLEQVLAADAAAVLFFNADLVSILDRLGNRGYRAAQLEAGVRGGKLYLSAYALGLGATGLTFYDDDVIDFFSPHAEGMEPVFVVALGVPARP